MKFNPKVIIITALLSTVFAGAATLGQANAVAPLTTPSVDVTLTTTTPGPVPSPSLTVTPFPGTTEPQAVPTIIQVPGQPKIRLLPNQPTALPEAGC